MMEFMSPRVFWPDEEPRSEEIDVAVNVLGNRINVAIVRFLAGRRSANMGTLQKALDINRVSLGAHLNEMEQYGVIVCDLPPEERRGRSVNYSLNANRFEALAVALTDYALRRSDTEPH